MMCGSFVCVAFQRRSGIHVGEVKEYASVLVVVKQYGVGLWELQRSREGGGHLRLSDSAFLRLPLIYTVWYMSNVFQETLCERDMMVPLTMSRIFLEGDCSEGEGRLGI